MTIAHVWRRDDDKKVLQAIAAAHRTRARFSAEAAAMTDLSDEGELKVAPWRCC
ncbi:MAG: hypothetical protein WAZ34_05280 [Rhodocyclaceae bacterium]